MKKNYFEGVVSAEELKKLYHTYIKMYHPDLNKGEDTTSIMAEINKQFDVAFKEVGTKHTKYDKQTNTYGTYTFDTGETAQEFKDIINKIIYFNGCDIELVGSWIWVSGNTKDYKDELAKLNFKFSGNKKAWSFHFGTYKKRSKIKYSLEDLRNKYGNVKYETEELTAIEG